MKSLKEIEKLLQNKTLHEDDYIELKEKLPYEDAVIAKHIVGLANNGGGYYIVGVRETLGTITLIGIKNIDPIIKKIKNICQKLTINVKCDINSIKINDSYIIIVSIFNLSATAYFKSDELIAYFRSHSGNVAYAKYEKIYKYMSLDSFILNIF